MKDDIRGHLGVYYYPGAPLCSFLPLVVVPSMKNAMVAFSLHFSEKRFKRGGTFSRAQYVFTKATPDTPLISLNPHKQEL